MLSLSLSLSNFFFLFFLVVVVVVVVVDRFMQPANIRGPMQFSVKTVSLASTKSVGSKGHDEIRELLEKFSRESYTLAGAILFVLQT
jgi:hypothetical protein